MGGRCTGWARSAPPRPPRPRRAARAGRSRWGRWAAGVLAAHVRRRRAPSARAARRGRYLPGDGRRRRGGAGTRAGGRVSATDSPAAEPPAAVGADQPLARLSTVRTGGAAQLFARAGTEAQLSELLAWAHGAGTAVSVVG